MTNGMNRCVTAVMAVHFFKWVDETRLQFGVGVRQERISLQ